MKKKIPRILYCILISWVLTLPGAAFGEIVKIKGGAFVKGEILKQTKSSLFLDIGFDVLRIPDGEIVEIVKNDLLAPQKKEEKQTIYRVEKTETITTAEASNHFGPAVVLVQSPAGLGSGFIVNKNGFLITNFHVIKGQKHINVTRYKQLKNKNELERVVHKKVRIAAIDSFHDLALLQITDDLSTEKTLSATVLSPGDELVVGEKVFVIGNPLGLERTVTEGVVSHTGRNLGGRLYHQIDAAINPGNSGGPLFNNRGQIIGVINMGIPGRQGLNFAIPVRHVKFLLDHIDSFAYNEANPLSGYVYLPPPPNPSKIAAQKKPTKKGGKKK
ncbi:MAG: trypsin-like serine protease [bacterium]|nr:trypsin-like serine protease [bacterium]